MNISHFNLQPVFTFFHDIPRSREHELFTAYVELAEEAAIYCRCGWRFSLPMAQLRSSQRESIEQLGSAAREHLRPAQPTLAEMTDWGWFDAES